jgi:8-oxo-dGTP diphosphatase
VAVFGERLRGAEYILRPSAYALITNPLKRLAVVRTVQGVFLPGGGIETDESPEEAVEREVLEECGFGIRLRSRLPGAIQLLYSPSELAYFEKPSAFFMAVVEGQRAETSASGHEVLWVASDDAEALLSHASHRWVLRYMES